METAVKKKFPVALVALLAFASAALSLMLTVAVPPVRPCSRTTLAMLHARLS